jgi:L-ascorbate metabolism protein UlaG (beta-lactamase superfamily)
MNGTAAITALSEPVEIGRYLRSLRDHDRAAIGSDGDDAEAIARLLDAHTVVMSHDHRVDEPVEESLATWLSLLDDDAWRARVREVRVDATYLRERELALLARVAAA